MAEYVIVSGTVYPLSTRDSKKYRFDLERIGGKQVLLLDDLNRWFAELWQGKTRGKTVALISIVVSLGIHP